LGPFKTKLYEICTEVASEFQGWSFVSGTFKNKSLKHSTLMLSPGFHIIADNTPLQPALFVQHRRSMALFKRLNGYELATSMVIFQTIPQLLHHTPEPLRLICSIVADKQLQFRLVPPSEKTRDSFVDITEARSVLRANLADGIALFEQLYDFSSEENFLRNLPPRYTTRSEKSPYDEFERQKGVMVCIVRALLGDFDFVHQYRDDTYQTIFPKRVTELDNLIAALPELRSQYSKTS
jgi:hypothetical protein